jgi:hypothetical protein
MVKKFGVAHLRCGQGVTGKPPKTQKTPPQSIKCNRLMRNKETVELLILQGLSHGTVSKELVYSDTYTFTRFSSHLGLGQWSSITQTPTENEEKNIEKVEKTAGREAGKVETDKENVETSTLVTNLRHVTGPFPVSPVPALAGEVAHRYRL